MDSKVELALKDQNDFAKIALAPGATGTLWGRVKTSDLAYYDATAAKWVVEEIEYEVKAGPSAGRAF